MRIVRKGWLVCRDLSYAEAAAWHVRQARAVHDPRERRWHAQQVEANRLWGNL